MWPPTHILPGAPLITFAVLDSHATCAITLFGGSFRSQRRRSVDSPRVSESRAPCRSPRCQYMYICEPLTQLAVVKTLRG